ncbi:AAA family ATPase [Kitasatospora arboriphila]
MHLKSLTLRGFKSFASATTLRFEPGITCVVGPNGSGKSNVVDALSWVMGEQGAKSLRGGKMEDVIFAACGGRAPLGRAEVSLTIDNTDGALPIDYSEVTITRTMFRNGGSEYALNGTVCRLLDIQELLSDSGIGREMHVIVGQGSWTPSCRPTRWAAAPSSRRPRRPQAPQAQGEGAAEARRDAGQPQPRPGPRRRTAPPARPARPAGPDRPPRRGIQAELRDARLRLLADDLLGLRRAVEAEIADELALKVRRTTVEQQLAGAVQREAVLEAQVEQLGPRLEAVRQTWYRLSALAERIRGTVGLAEAKVRHARTGVEGEERRGRDPEELLAEAVRVREEEAALAEALEEAQYALAETVETRGELERSLAAEETRLKSAARAIADRREGLARLQGQAAAARSRAAAAEAEIGRLTEAAAEAAQRAGTAQQEYRELQEETDGLAAADDDHERAHEQARADLQEAEHALAAARDAAAAAERERAGLTARHEALSLGLRRKDGSGALLTAADRPAGVLGSAAELLTVHPGHETALAAALGAAAEAVAVDGPDTAAEALRLLRKQDAGRAALLLADAPRPTGAERPARPELPDGAHWAADLVDAPAGLRAAVDTLLARTAVVADLAAAGELTALHPGLTAVTADGDLLAAAWAQGGAAGAPSLLETQAQVAEAARRIDELDVRCAQLTEELAAAAERRRELSLAQDESAAARRRAERERAQLAGALGRSAGQARAAAGEAERLAAAAERAEQGLADARDAAEELTARLEAAEELDAAAEDEPDTAERDRLAAAGTTARATEMEARLAVRTHEERVRSLVGRADQLDRAAAAEREARARAARRRARARHEAAVATAVADGARVLLAAVGSSLTAADAERTAVEQDRTGREAELRTAREHGRELKAELDRLVDAGHRDEVLRAEKRLRIEQLESRALEEFGIGGQELIDGYGPDQPVPPPVPEDGAEPGEPRPYDRAEQEKRLKAAERAYQQLGKVNPLALEEFAALEERHRFLGEQLDDLKKSRAT